MVWAAVLGVFLQLWINFEVGRWTVATGETVYTGYARVWRGFSLVFILLTLLGWLGTGFRTGAQSTASGNGWVWLRYLLDCNHFCRCGPDSIWAQIGLQFSRKKKFVKILP